MSTRRWSSVILQHIIRFCSSGLSMIGIRLQTKCIVGIVSREGEATLRWLSDILQSEVQEVKHIFISNRQKLQCSDEVFMCNFAIIYHSKKRGRNNITDVTDALYNEELEYLSSRLGKERVCVVADDLEYSKPEEKERMLTQQFSIGKKACELYLFTNDEKRFYKTDRLMKEKLEDMMYHISSSIWPYQIIREPNPRFPFKLLRSLVIWCLELIKYILCYKFIKHWFQIGYRLD